MQLFCSLKCIFLLEQMRFSQQYASAEQFCMVTFSKNQGGRKNFVQSSHITGLGIILAHGYTRYSWLKCQIKGYFKVHM